MNNELPEYNINNLQATLIRCLFCENQKINNHSKSFKSLDSLIKHIVRCPSAEYEQEQKAEFFRLVKKAKTEPESYLKLMKIGVILP